MIQRKTIRMTLLAGLALVLVGPVLATEWTQWRGPNSNGVSAETGLVSGWTPHGENTIWHSEFIGRSTPVVFDGRACVIGRVGEDVDRQEVVACFDAENGRKLWERRHNVYNTTVPFNRLGWASLVGDKETGYIYANGAAGQLIAYDRDGKVVWSHSQAEDFGRLSGYGGRTQTPLIDGDQLILSSVSSGWGKQAAPRHRYFSFDKRNGEVLWIATPGKFPYDMNTQSVPVIAEVGGKRLLISGNADGHIYALEPGTGELVWKFELSKRGINSSVLVEGNRVFVSHSEENLDDATMGRAVAIDATGTGDVTKTHELWRINEFSSGFPSPTYHDGILYAVDNSANLSAIDTAEGKILWTHGIGTVGKGSPVWADGKLFVTETNGHLVILEPSREGVKQLDKDEVEMEDGRYAEIYASPAIAYGRVYLSTEAGLFCIGDKNRRFASADEKKPKRAKYGKAKKRKDRKNAIRADLSRTPSSIQVVPAEVMIRPGQVVDFRVRTFDSDGEFLDERAATSWELNRLSGSIDASGVYRPGKAQKLGVGTVKASVGSLAGESRVRVIPELPWTEDFESIAIDKVPAHWVGAPVKWKVQDKDGNKVLTKLFRERGLLRNALYMGPATMNNYTIEADVMGNQRGRRKTDVGLIANGYTMDLMGSHQRIQVRSWASEERMAQEFDFPWEMGVWYHMKMRVDSDTNQALIRGKVWPKGQDEPADWTIEVKDPLPIRSGSPGLVGYSPADGYFDNIKVTGNK